MQYLSLNENSCKKNTRESSIYSLCSNTNFAQRQIICFFMHCSIRVTTLQPFHIDDKMHLRRCLLDYLAIFSMCFWSGFRCVFISWTFISQYSFLSYQNMVLKAMRRLGYALSPRRQGITRTLWCYGYALLPRRRHRNTTYLIVTCVSGLRNDGCQVFELSIFYPAIVYSILLQYSEF